MSEIFAQILIGILQAHPEASLVIVAALAVPVITGPASFGHGALERRAPLLAHLLGRLGLDLAGAVRKRPQTVRERDTVPPTPRNA